MDKQTRAVLYLRATVALVLPVAVDVVVSAVLVRRADEDYEDYRRNVDRWGPRRLGVVVRRRDERA